jgi:hypothetical protein
MILRTTVDRSHRAEAGLLTSGWPGKNVIALQFAGATQVDAGAKPAAPGVMAETSSAVTTPAIDVAVEDAGPTAATTIFEVMNVNDTERAELKILSDNFAQNSQMLELLRRYRTSAENSFYRALHELQREQALERDGQIAPPLAVDVNVNSNGFGSGVTNRDTRSSGNGK